MNTIEKKRFLDLNREVRSKWHVYFEVNQKVLSPDTSGNLLADLKNAWDEFQYSSANLDSFMQHIIE